MIAHRSRRIHDHHRKSLARQTQAPLVRPETWSVCTAPAFPPGRPACPRTQIPPFGIPIQPTVLVYTHRSTPALRAAASRLRVPSTFERNISSGSRRPQPVIRRDMINHATALHCPCQRFRDPANRPAPSRFLPVPPAPCTRAGSRTSARTRSPRSSNCRATCQPTNPVAPVTRRRFHCFNSAASSAI